MPTSSATSDTAATTTIAAPPRGAANGQINGANIVKSPTEALAKATKRTNKWVPVDGNEATANVAYQCSNVSFIYPVSCLCRAQYAMLRHPCLHSKANAG